MGNVNYAIFGATGTVGKALASKLAERANHFVWWGAPKSACVGILLVMNLLLNTAQPT